MFRVNTVNVTLSCAVLLIGGCFCAGCNSSSDNGPSASNTPAQHGIIPPPPPDPRTAEARRFFVEDFWNKRFTKCSDGWYKARIDTNITTALGGRPIPQLGWFAVKVDPQTLKMDVITLNEADKLRGFTWAADGTLEASVTIAFLDDHPSGGRWQKYHDGWAAMGLGALGASDGLVSVGDQIENQIDSENKQIHLRVFYNEKTTPHWNVDMSPGYYSDIDAMLVRSWLIYGAKPANCAEFPQMP